VATLEARMAETTMDRSSGVRMFTPAVYGQAPARWLDCASDGSPSMWDQHSV
jgi:hypothetical protein